LLRIVKQALGLYPTTLEEDSRELVEMGKTFSNRRHALIQVSSSSSSSSSSRRRRRRRRRRKRKRRNGSGSNSGT